MNNEIFSIDKLRELANPVIQIPGFDYKSTINIRVQQPRLMAMASQGKIPNHLMNIATLMISGKKLDSKELTQEQYIKEIHAAMELYCRACMVEPSYEDMKDILTDDQKATIFNWGIGKVQKLDSFREDKKDGASNNNGKALQEKTK